MADLKAAGDVERFVREVERIEENARRMFSEWIAEQVREARRGLEALEQLGPVTAADVVRSATVALVTDISMPNFGPNLPSMQSVRIETSHGSHHMPPPVIPTEIPAGKYRAVFLLVKLPGD